MSFLAATLPKTFSKKIAVEMGTLKDGYWTETGNLEQYQCFFFLSVQAKIFLGQVMPLHQERAKAIAEAGRVLLEVVCL